MAAVATLLSSPLVLADEALIRAAKRQDFDSVTALIDAGANVNSPSSDGTTLLHWAVFHGNHELAENLIRQEVNVNASNDYGVSPLSEAAAVGNAEMIELLLEAGADVESPNHEGQTALMAVARTGNLDAAKLLIKHGADLNAVENWGGQTALMWAAARQHPDMVKLLIENGAILNKRAQVRDWERRVTAEPRVKEMLSGGLTPLLYAVREDCLECVRVLVESGADMNLPDPDNVSPLILALINMRFDIAKYLIEAGAEVNQWDYYGRTPLYAVADVNIVPTSTRGDLPPVQNTTGIEIAEMLLTRKANPDLRLKLYPPPRNIVFDRAHDNPFLTTGSTPLQRAAYGADLEMMSLLLASGADVHLANINDFTPVLALVNPGGTRSRGKDQNKIIQGLDMLVAAGATLSDKASNYDFTNAAGFNEKGGYSGESPLHLAVRLNWLDVVRYLVTKGADLAATDDRGFIPLDYATGKAEIMTEGNFGLLGELPEMAALVRELMTNADTSSGLSTSADQVLP
jgi:ankyrin repeat protein